MDGDGFQSIPWWFLITAFVALLALSGVFSGVEVALFALPRSGRTRPRLRKARFRRVRRLIESSESTLTTIQLTTLVLNLAAALVAVRMARQAWPGGGWGALWLGLGMGGLALLVFGVAVPRAVAVRWPESFARRVAPFLELAVWAFTPLTRVFLWAASCLLRSSLSSQQISRTIRGEEEFKALLTTSEVTGLLQEQEREMIDSVFEFADTTAEEIMTPRRDIEGYPVALSQREMLDTLRQTPYSRVVVYENTPDQIMGMLLAKDVLLHPDIPWRESLQKPLFVPSSMELPGLLGEFKRSRSRVAVVLDEFGGTAGLVTLHDLVEEIVGEMPEEEEPQEAEIERIEPGVFLVVGHLEVAKCNDVAGTAFPLDTARSMAGMVFTHLGQVPAVGTEVTLGNGRIRVLEVDENRIVRLELRVVERQGPRKREEKEAVQESTGSVAAAASTPEGVT